MAAAGAAELNLIDSAVIVISDALVSQKQFNSLCQTAIRRYGRSTVLKRLTSALAAFARVLSKGATTALEKATAGILRGCRTAIALRVCELLSPEKQALENLLISLSQSDVPSNPHRLIQFFDERFTNGEQYPSGMVYFRQDLDLGDDLLHDGDYHHESDGDNNLPNLEVFSNVDELKIIICSGSAMNGICQHLKTALFSTPSSLLKQTLQKYVLDNGERKSIACVVGWQLLEYVKYENVNADDLDSIFTLTGELQAARTYRLSDYMTSVWSSGNEMLSVVKELIRKSHEADSNSIRQGLIATSSNGIELQIFPALDGLKEQAYLKLTGTFDVLNERLEQVAWLAATLRPHYDGQLTVSDVQFNIQQAPLSTSKLSIAPTVFSLSLYDQEQTLLADSDMPGQCWTSVFTESVLAHGFRLPTNDNVLCDVLGLEVPFEFMAAFTGVKYPISIKDRMVFAGRSCVLVPEQKVGSDSIQWHFHRMENWMEHVIRHRSKHWDARLETASVSSLMGLRAFLGYCKNSEVLLGTAEFEHVDVSESGVPAISKIAVESSEASLRLSIDDKGYGLARDGARWKFNRGEVGQINCPETNPDRQLMHAVNNSVLLYDQNSCVAFLISELSVVLQLVAVYLRTESELKRQRIPLAKVTADGGTAAYEAIIQAKDVTIAFAERPTRTYIEVVMSFLDILEQRRTQALVRKRYSNDVVSGKTLRGWDHLEIQTKQHSLWEREMPAPASMKYPVWWNLFQNLETLILFTRMSKDPIRNTTVDVNDGSYNCRAWDEVPRGQHLLLASTVQLQRLRTDLCQNPRKCTTRYMLDDDLVWARPRNTRLFEQTCKDGAVCNPIQTMAMLGARRDVTGPTRDKAGEPVYLQHPGKLEDEGAVLFADVSSKFEPRRCWRHARPPVLGRSEWNYPFIAVSFVVVAFAYWNIRLVALNLILLAVAKYLK